MLYRKLPGTDIELSVVGLGSWSFGSDQGPSCWGPIDDSTVQRVIHRAIGRGINWIDTAPIYGCGLSEERIGTALSKTTRTVFIATKCGLRWNRKGRIRPDLTDRSIRIECEASLQRLGREVIDLYQVHWPIPPKDVPGALDTLTDLQRQGKVRWFGICNVPIDDLPALCDPSGIRSLQSEWNLLVPGDVEQTPTWCKERGLGFLAYSPLASGILAGLTPPAISALPKRDWRRWHPRFAIEVLRSIRGYMAELESIARCFGFNLPELALAWVLQQAGVTAAIAGARKPDRISSWEKSAACPLDGAVLGAIQSARSRWKVVLHRFPPFHDLNRPRSKQHG